MKEEKQVEAFVERIRKINLKVQEQLKESQAKYNLRHEKHRVDYKFHAGDHFWLHLSKERLQGTTKKLKPIRNGAFDIMDKVNENGFRLNLLAYMNIYLVMNVENLKFYEPSKFTEDEAGSYQNILFLDDLTSHTMDEIKEEYIL